MDATMPMGVDALPPWLVPDWQRLQRARDCDRLPHALMLAGPRGVGKRLLARHLAQALLCRQPLPDGRACGRCQDCGLSAAGAHPDLRGLVPDADSKSGEIGVDSVRDVTEWVALTSGRGARKQVLVDPADHLNAAAANALLKTLEEPPGDSLLCLIAEQPSRLPATIRSRCQILKLAPPPREQALDWLSAQLGGDTKGAALRLDLAGGAPLRALQELDSAMLALHGRLGASLQGMASGELDPVREADGWNRIGARLSLDWLAGWLCDLIRLGTAGPSARLVDAGCRETYAEIGGRLDAVETHRLWCRVIAARRLADTTANPVLLLESLLITWSRMNGH